jgi:hypothetical protein
MPDWLLESVHDHVEISTTTLLMRLGVAFVLGCVAAAIHALTTQPAARAANKGLLATLVILSVLLAVIPLVIGSNVARAFSLVGALAIVRFRTVVEDTRDTAFVVFAVTGGMAAGVGKPLAAFAAAPLVLVAAWAFRPAREEQVPPGHTLVLRLGIGRPVEEEVRRLLRERLPGARLTALATARGGAALDMTYATPALAAEQALALVAELNRIDGVQGVELKES